ncbi:hypothetical protein LZ32DRAFT_619661 [Colletotrichum eremochloae]|nr:hypothetical protein LZ32DRAFT_619661 [Colletotrichum eremochloae]
MSGGSALVEAAQTSASLPPLSLAPTSLPTLLPTPTCWVISSFNIPLRTTAVRVSHPQRFQPGTNSSAAIHDMSSPQKERSAPETDNPSPPKKLCWMLQLTTGEKRSFGGFGGSGREPCTQKFTADGVNETTHLRHEPDLDYSPAAARRLSVLPSGSSLGHFS